jgi:hypothetical protein
VRHRHAAAQSRIPRRRLVSLRLATGATVPSTDRIRGLGWGMHRVRKPSVGARHPDTAPVVSQIEAGKRRVDVVEFVLIVRVLEGDLVEIFAAIARSDDAVDRGNKAQWEVGGLPRSPSRSADSLWLTGPPRLFHSDQDRLSASRRPATDRHAHEAGSGAVGARSAIAETGTGAGQVTSSPAGINCSASTNQCAAPFALGTLVTLTASASTGSSFTGWSGGGCSSTGTCVVPMSAAQSVTASFKKKPTTKMLSVALTGGGSGTVTTPSGIKLRLDVFGEL